MSNVSTGNDSVTLKNRIFSDFADGDYAKLTFDNDSATAKTGKNGNTIFASNEMGNQGKFELRLLKGSSDDKFLNAEYANQKSNFAGFVLFFGEYIKRMGNGAGNVQNDTYILSAGVITRGVDAKSNAEGDTEQGVSVWKFTFAVVPRSIS